MTLLFALLLLQDAEALSAKALELAQARQPAEAEKLWKQALAINPKLFSAAFNLGYLYYSQKQPTEAEPFLATAAKSQPKDFNTQYLLGVVRSQLGRTDDALRAWRTALTIRSDHVRLMQIMAVEYGKGNYFREAGAVAERALALKGDDRSTWLVAIKSWQDAGDHAAALRLTEKMITRFPEDPRAAFEHGFELYRAGRRDEAMPFIEKALHAPQPWEEPFFFLGDILFRENRPAEAVPLLQKALELRPDYSAAAVVLARALMSLDKNEEAKDILLRAATADPKNAQPHLLLSQLYFRLGDEAAAAREKEISSQLRKTNPQALEGTQSRPFPP